MIMDILVPNLTLHSIASGLVSVLMFIGWLMKRRENVISGVTIMLNQFFEIIFNENGLN